jgi:hypothetical protein
MGGGSKGGSGGSSYYQDTVAQDLLLESVKRIGEEQWSITKPIEQQWAQQALELMQTGGVQSYNPIISSATEAVKRATSQAMKGTEASLATSGLAGTPYGERILAETGLQGSLTESQVASNTWNSLVAGIPSFATTVGGTATSALSSAAGTQANIISSQNQLAGAQAQSDAAKGAAKTGLLGNSLSGIKLVTGGSVP